MTSRISSRLSPSFFNWSIFRRRPIVFLAPLVQPHDKEFHRLVLLHAVVFAFEPVVVPAQLYAHQISHIAAGHQTVVAFREDAGHTTMRPGTDEETLMLPRHRAATALLHSDVILQGGSQEDVMPPADVERWHRDLLVCFLMGNAAPVVIVTGMGQPIEIVRSEIPQERHIHKREALELRRRITHGLHERAHLFHAGLALPQLSLQFLWDHEQGPPERDTKLEHTALMTPGRLIIVRGRHDRSHSP